MEFAPDAVDKANIEDPFMDQVAGALAPPWIEEDQTAQNCRLRAGGAWTMTDASGLFNQLNAIAPGVGVPVEIDLAEVTRMDTGGAWLFYRTAKRLEDAGHSVTYCGSTEDQDALLAQAKANDNPCVVEPFEGNSLTNMVASTGKGVEDAAKGVITSVGFIGLVLTALGRSLANPRRFRLTATVYQMEVIGLNALPIVGLVSFLIGVVIAYQGAYQLQLFGAQIFTVNLVVVAVLREFGILLAAIIIAGRSGSAFTAQIGSMKLNEEIDAMRALAIDPIDVLVIPRFVALTIIMPILTFYADFMGILGGMVISWITLDISPALFIERANQAIRLWDLWVGLIKAPIFGMIIALIGCYEGLAVGGSAESLGTRTTRSVVQAIFTIIVLDAFFAVFFTSIGI